MDLTVRRNGETIVLKDVDMTKRDYVVDGQTSISTAWCWGAWRKRPSGPC